MTDEEAKDILNELLPISYEYNEIFWGKGLPVEDAVNSDRYQPVKKDCGFSSVDDILSGALEVYSEDFVKDIKDALFTTPSDEEVDANQPRYLDIGGTLKKDIQNKGFTLKQNIIVSSATIVRQNLRSVKVKVDYEDGGSVTLQLVSENGKWKLNNPTY